MIDLHQLGYWLIAVTLFVVVPVLTTRRSLVRRLAGDRMSRLGRSPAGDGPAALRRRARAPARDPPFFAPVFLAGLLCRPGSPTLATNGAAINEKPIAVETGSPGLFRRGRKAIP